jgi:gamma-glutamyl-gamma-aminobutyrate hydrolase PuuD
MTDIRVGLVGTCGFRDFRMLTGGSLITDVSEALRKNILIFTGGEDIDPAIYGEENTHCGYINKPRDKFEKDVLTHALAYGIKVLGICRGHQLINAILGGKLFQDIGIDAKIPHSDDARVNGQYTHEYRPDPTRFWKNKSLGYIFPYTNSLHHQAVSIPGKGLDVILRSRDGIIEATANKDGTIVTFQFHPEWLVEGRNYFDKVLETGNLIW